MISARNKIRGIIKEIERRTVLSLIRIYVNDPFVITAVIAREASDELKISKGDSVKVVIKATEVMIRK